MWVLVIFVFAYFVIFVSAYHSRAKRVPCDGWPFVEHAGVVRLPVPAGARDGRGVGGVMLCCQWGEQC